ncbi:MAG: glycosyltransferase [Thermoguttaceae bacterium]
MHVTVAICTWNRARLLDQTLTGLHALRIPEGITWELLVVNNRSTDDTDAVISRHADTLRLRRLCEPKQGLSNARNCAVRAARGDLLVWTDDDVLVEPGWLEEYVRAAREWPQAAFFGGAVHPWFPKAPPRWIVRNFSLIYGYYAVCQLGAGIRPLSPGELPYGANMGFRTDVLKQFPFNPNLGRTGKTLFAHEEVDVLARMRAAGYQGVWVGSARVSHYIPPERLTARYLWRSLRESSQAQCRIEPPSPAIRLWGAPRWVWRAYFTNLAIQLCLSPLRSRRWLIAFKEAATMRGIIDEERMLSERNRRSTHAQTV